SGCRASDRPRGAPTATARSADWSRLPTQNWSFQMHQSHPSIAAMDSLGFSGAARRLFATSFVAQLPLGMLGIGLLVHAQRQTGSFAVAGLITGVYGISVGVGGPLLGQLVDRGPQTAVLLASAGAGAVLLGAAAILPAHVSVAMLLALATGIGL